MKYMHNCFPLPVRRNMAFLGVDGKEQTDEQTRLSQYYHLELKWRQRNWLRHYATNRKVVGSSLDEVDFFQLT
jgi:hypothetical protein